MKHFLFFISTLILAGCSSDSSPNSRDKTLNQGTTDPIYLGPIEYDTLVKSVRERLKYEKDDSSGFIPANRSILMTFTYKGRFKKYMKHGTMNVEPWDSSVVVHKINDSIFKFKVLKRDEQGVVSMRFIPTLKKPYYLIWTREGRKDTVPPGEAIPLFLRSYITKDATISK